MNQSPPSEAEKRLLIRVDQLRSDLALLDPVILAHRTGASYERVGDGEGEFRLPFWGRPILISYPDFVARGAPDASPLPAIFQALLIYHFHDADGTPRAYRWIAFSELSDGAFYAQAFQGYTGNRLLQVFGEDIDAFESAATALGGERLSFADSAFSFQALPRLAFMAVCWLGDEDFSPSYRILVDASANHQLSTDGIAILGSMLTQQLIRTEENQL